MWGHGRFLVHVYLGRRFFLCVCVCVCVRACLSVTLFVLVYLWTCEFSPGGKRRYSCDQIERNVCKGEFTIADTRASDIELEICSVPAVVCVTADSKGATREDFPPMTNL